MTKKPLAPKVEGPTAFESPESNLIARASYSPESRELMVTLKVTNSSKEVRYLYGGVDAPTWEEFATADSKGGYFGKVIRPMYAGKRLE